MYTSLKDVKTIHLIPYSHHDHAWTNTRQWHIWRYLEGFCTVLDVMRDNPDYTFTIDNVLHSLEVFEQYCPHRMDEFKLRIAEGRIEVVNGGMALARPSLFDGELYLRNIVLGKKELASRLSEEEIPVFFNADTAVGHSQMPQILKLSGHKHYRFFRPEGVLDYEKVPRDFRWKGLDGSEIVASRGVYGGFMYANWSELPRGKWEQIRESFIEEDLKDKLDLASTDQIPLNLGCDDVLPLANLMDKEIDVFGFVNDWNKHEDTKIKFSSFSQYHNSIIKSDLPSWNNPLDPCELSYNAPIRADYSLWRKRTEGERLLITAEKLAIILESLGRKVDKKPISDFWLRMMRISGHAMQWLLYKDYEDVIAYADTTLSLIREQIEQYHTMIAALTTRQSQVQYVAINVSGFDRTENIELHITSPHHVHGLVLRDSEGNKIDYQFIELFNGDKGYVGKDFNEVKVTCNIKVPALGYTCIFVEFDNQEIQNAAKNQCSPFHEQNFTIDNGVYVAEINQGIVRKLIKKSDNSLVYQSKLNNFGSVRLYHTTPTPNWTTNWDDIAVDTFIPEHVIYKERGPIRFTYISIGRIGRHPAELETVFVKDSPKILYRLRINNLGAEGYFAATFPCNEDPSIIAGIPFGQENRDTGKIAYSQNIGEVPDNYLFFERGCNGGFYANGFASFDINNSRLAILQGNCNVYYRNLHKSREVELILMKSLNLSTRTEEWMTKTAPSISGVGIQHFEFAVSLLQESAGLEAHQLSESIRYPFETATRYHYTEGMSSAEHTALSVSSGSLILTSIFKDNEGYVLRLFESEGESGKALISIHLPFSKAYRVDLCGNAISEATILQQEIELPYHGWEICTIYLKE